MLARIISRIMKVLAHIPLTPFKGGISRKQMKRATVYEMKSPPLKGDKGGCKIRLHHSSATCDGVTQEALLFNEGQVKKNETWDG
jgi:hypothetical protein